MMHFIVGSEGMRYWLTPEGKEIAKHLIEIEKIMEKIEKKREEG